jgi:hypothetical protein
MGVFAPTNEPPLLAASLNPVSASFDGLRYEFGSFGCINVLILLGLDETA